MAAGERERAIGIVSLSLVAWSRRSSSGGGSNPVWDVIAAQLEEGG